MKNIVAHSLEKLYTEFEKADQLFLDSGMKDMDAYEKGLEEAARRAAAEHMQALYNSMDQMLCDDILRNKKYTIQRHDTRELLTINGPIRFTHTLFRNREDGSYHYLLDEWLGLDAHERLSSAAETAVLVEATRSSYSRAANQMLDDANEVKGRLWKALYKGKKKKFVKTLKAVRKCAPNEKAVNECEEYVLNNWDSAVLRMQDKNVYGCSAEGHVSHVYSDRMSSRPMGWSETGADAMCQLRCYVRDYGEEKVIDLVHYRREHKQLEATGTEDTEPKFARGYLKKLLHGQHDSDRVYLEKMQATIPSIEIRKKLAIRERISNI